VTPDYAQYERMKAEWVASHPNATPTEYTEAIRKIAKDCGV